MRCFGGEWGFSHKALVKEKMSMMIGCFIIIIIIFKYKNNNVDSDLKRLHSLHFLKQKNLYDAQRFKAYNTS